MKKRYVAMLFGMPLITLVLLACGAAQAQPYNMLSRFATSSSAQYSKALVAVSGAPVTCSGGTAGAFACNGIDLQAFLPVSDIGGSGSLNDIWGWTDSQTGNEYALVGRTDGTAFVDVTDPVNPVYLGKLPTHTGNSSWRDIKTYADHAFIVSDNNGNHGMQVFDLTQLRTVASPPVTFAETAHYGNVASTHNIVINEDTGFAYAVGNGSGGTTCSGGLHMINIQDPLNPTFAGCYSSDGYTHDAQCVIYDGPDTAHQGKEICVASNEDTITIVDVTNKANPVQLSRTGYPTSQYVHQGWLTEDHRYFYQNDELDGGNTRTFIWDVMDLDNPVQTVYSATTTSKDHNLYTRGDQLFEANYTTGLRLLDISDPLNPLEVGFFDTYTPNNGSSFNGAWSSYPYFASDNIIVSSIGEGLFVLRPADVGSVATISGRTLLPGGAQAVGGVTLDLDDTNVQALQSTISASDGSYGLTAGLGGDYTVVPSLDTDTPPSRGVSSLDILAIQSHILTRDLLDTPYAIIAADVDNSNTVDGTDILRIQQVVLTTATDFPGGGLWRFVRSDYVFPDPTNPLAHPFDEVRTYANLAGNMTDQDFIAIKHGDVDVSWTPPASTTPKGSQVAGVVHMVLDPVAKSTADEVLVPIRVRDFDEVAAYQFTLAWDPSVLAYSGVEQFGLPGLGSHQFGAHRAAEGRLTTVWTDPQVQGETLPDGAALFVARFKIIGTGDTSLQLSSDPTPVEAYRSDRTPLDIRVEQGTATAVEATEEVPTAFALEQNYPNPFNPVTAISYALPQGGSVRLAVYDATGREVAVLVASNQEAGRHEAYFDASGLPSGVYYYRLDVGDFSATKRMVLLK